MITVSISGILIDLLPRAFTHSLSCISPLPLFERSCHAHVIEDKRSRLPVCVAALHYVTEKNMQMIISILTPRQSPKADRTAPNTITTPGNPTHRRSQCKRTAISAIPQQSHTKFTASFQYTTTEDDVDFPHGVRAQQ